MNDGDFGFGIFIGLIFGFFIASMLYLVIDTSSDDAWERKTEQKRFGLCLKKNMQWIDGNCISSK